jgi:arabinose-5-phosphate isomerase
MWHLPCEQTMHNHHEVAERVFDKEAAALLRTKHRIGDNFNSAVELLMAAKGKIVVTGIGKSGIIGHKIAATFSSTGTPAVFVNAAEGLHGDLGVVCPEDVVLMVSNSAETEELYRWLDPLDAIGAKALGIFGRIDTRLGSRCHLVIDASVAAEACPLNVAPMSSTTVALVIGDALAAALMEARHFTREQFSVFHPGGALGKRLFLRVGDVALSVNEVAVVNSESTIAESLKTLEQHNLGLVLVTNSSRKLTGVVSEADFRRCMLRRLSLDTLVSDVMTKNPIVVTARSTLDDALKQMEGERKVYVLPVVDDEGKIAGIIRMHDIVRQK